MSDQERSGCLKRLTCGCLGIVGLVVVAALALTGVGWLQRPGPAEPKETTVHHAVGSAPAATDGAPAATDGAPAATDDADATAAEPLPPGSVRLALEEGSFDVMPAAPGEPLRVEASYDAATHELTEVLDQGSGGAWTYDLAFESKLGWLGALFAGKRETPRVTLFLPRGSRIALGGSISKAQSHLELGGLDLSDVDLEVSMGQHEIAFSEPSPTPAAGFRLAGSMGQVTVIGLGHASPAQATLSQTMGQLEIDLGGAWRRGADIDVRFKLGQASVRVPEDVSLEIVKAHVDAGEVVLPRMAEVVGSEETGAAVLRLTATGTAGELRISRH